MQQFLTILLLGAAALMAVQATPLNQAGQQDVIDIDSVVDVYEGKIPLQKLDITTEVEHFTYGNEVEGALPVYNFGDSLNYDTSQNVFKGLQYPVDGDASPSDDVIITQIIAHVEGSDGMDCQIYIIKGGIGEKSITLQMMALNTYSLRYVVVVYGKKV